jgi:hypothetical protein
MVPSGKKSLSPYEQLEATKELLLSEIRILDFDHETGKIPTDVYERAATEAARMQWMTCLSRP